MTVFFTDLDNTLIYSHRHSVSEPVVWVEELQGKRQSFMTEKTFSFLEKQNWLDVVPITTRTREQYDRLRGVAEKLRWQNALICNGAILLKNNVEDPMWTKESIARSEIDRDAYLHMYEFVCDQYRADSVCSVFPFLFYLKTDRVNDVYDTLLEKADLAHVNIYRDTRKVYCIPKSLSKGAAVERYKRRFGKQSCMGAGDSMFDVSFIEQTDLSVCHENIRDMLEPKPGRYFFSDLLSNHICELFMAIGEEKLVD